MKQAFAIFLAWLSLEAAWTPAVQISTIATSNLISTSYDSFTQTLLASWTDTTSNAYPFAAVSTDHGTTWQPATQITNLFGSFNSFNGAFTAYDPAHNVTIAAWNANSGPQPVASAVSNNGGSTWQTAQTISNASNSQGVSLLYNSGSQTIIAGFLDTSNQKPQSMISINGGSTWQTPVQISNDSGFPYIAYDSSTNTLVAARPGGSNFPTVSFSTDGGNTWNSNLSISLTPYFHCEVFILYNSTMNTLIASWTSSTHAPMVASSSNGGTSWTTVNVSSFSVPNGSWPFIAFDPTSGVTMATWPSGGLPFYALSQDGGFTWGSAAQISTVAVTGNVFVSFDSGSNSFVATWRNLSDNTPYSSTYPLTPPSPPPPPPSPPPPPGPPSPSPSQIAAQATTVQQTTSNVEQQFNNNLLEVQDIGILGAQEGTLVDTANIPNIIDGESSYTLEVPLPPIWCE